MQHVHSTPIFFEVLSVSNCNDGWEKFSSAARRYLKVQTGAVALSKCDRDAEEGAALVAPYFGFTVIRRARQRCPSTILYSGIRRPFTLLQNSPPWHLPSTGPSGWVCGADTTLWYHAHWHIQTLMWAIDFASFINGWIISCGVLWKYLRCLTFKCMHWLLRTLNAS